MANKQTPLLHAHQLKVQYPILGGILPRVIGHVHAVQDVSVQVYPGEIVALVGESGCGKSSLGLALLGLTKISSGTIELDGQRLDLSHLSSFKKFRRDFQIIFQDPYLALNPRHSVYEILAEPLLFHGLASRKNIKEKIAFLLQKVGLSTDQIHRYPHTFSGGQRQRLCIARVISLEPKLIICDEVVSALDLSVQAQIVQLFLQLKKELQLSLLWISHDLSLVRNISDRVSVMYLGKIVEQARCEELFNQPKHPYSKALLDAIPTLDAQKKPVRLEGEPPPPTKLPKGCAFHTRCPKVQDRCKIEVPPLKQIGQTKHKSQRQVACFFPLEI